MEGAESVTEDDTIELMLDCAFPADANAPRDVMAIKKGKA